MKKTASFLLFTLLAVVLLTGSAFASHIPETKVSDWASPVVEYFNRSGLLSPDLYFSDLTRPITRAELATLVADISDTIPRPRDRTTSWPYYLDSYRYEDRRAGEIGTMLADPENRFRPGDRVTREELAYAAVYLRTAIYRIPCLAPLGYYPPYYDYAAIDDWAKPCVGEAAYSGIMNGWYDGCFHPFETVSVQETLSVLSLVAALPQKSKPTITWINEQNFVDSDKEFYVCVACEDSDYVLYDYHDGRTQEIGTLIPEAGAFLVSAGELNKPSPYSGYFDDVPSASDVHYLYVSNGGVMSNPVRVFADRYSIAVYGEFSETDDTVTVSWNAVPHSWNYRVSIVQNRYTVGNGDILPAPAVTCDLTAETTSLTFPGVRERVYEVTVSALDEGSEDISGTVRVYTAYNERDYALAEQIEASRPTTEAESKALVTNITVPVWKLKNGKKTASQITLTVHSLLADKYAAVFDDIFNGPEQFPIQTAVAYSWRGVGSTSEHCLGTAIDINADANYCVYGNGTVVGLHWEPYEDPLSITPYGDVVQAFERHGFTWGGDAWKAYVGTTDFMHFSYLGT